MSSDLQSALELQQMYNCVSSMVVSAFGMINPINQPDTVAVVTVFLYDYVLTFSSEVHYVWVRKQQLSRKV
ncbi:hypothetical protein HD554DRAFT_2178180 [Boletus coccyginus]|nr:hypothetical protein HD554DRAFT_2178180 [Boletus coccyginus]